MMTKLLILCSFLTLPLTINAQSASLSTFEEMWIVGSEFTDFKVEMEGLKAFNMFNKDVTKNIKSFEDLNNIIADTPFLSIAFEEHKQASKFDGPSLLLSEKVKSAKSLKGWGSFLVLFERKGEIVLGIPTMQPEKLAAYLNEHPFVLSDKAGIPKNLKIKEIRIENGTYGSIK